MPLIKEKIQELAQIHGESIASVERTLGFANGSISKWDKQSPSAERLKKVADYFNVSVDHLLGSEKKNSKPEKIDIKNAIDDEDVIMTFEGREIPREDLEVIKRLLRRD